MKKVKCQIIPAYVYDGIPPTAFEDSNHRYIKGHKGHFIRVTRKTCSECGNPAVFIGIFKYKKHLRVERLCQDHATNYGKVPPLVPQEQEDIPPRWSSMKIRI